MQGVCCPTFDNCPPIGKRKFYKYFLRNFLLIFFSFFQKCAIGHVQHMNKFNSISNLLFLDDVKIGSTKETESKTSRNDLLISLSPTPPTAASSPSVEKNPMLQLANENPLGITIKEITKPEEIRFTDDKPKPFNPFKSTTTTTTTTTTVSPSTTTSEISTEDVTKSLSTTESTSTTTINSVSTEISSNESTEDTNQSNGEHESHDYMDDGALSGDTSSAPPTKVSKEDVEPQVLLSNADSNTIGDESSNKSVRQTTENSTNIDFDLSSESSSELYSSTTESYLSIESSTPFGDGTSTQSSGEETDLASSTPQNVVVVRHGGKTESFHISGTEYLQRVEILDVLNSTTGNSQEIDESGIQSSSEQPDLSSTFESFERLYNKSIEEMVMESSSSTVENFDEIGTVSPAIEKKLDNTLNLNLDDNSTEHLTNNSIEVSTPFGENSAENSSEILTSAEQIYGTVYYNEEILTASPSTEEVFDPVYYGSTEDVSDASSTPDAFDASSTSDPNALLSTTVALVSTTEPSSARKAVSTEPYTEATSRFSIEEEDSTLPENPEYPPIPDDVSWVNTDIEERRAPSKVIEDSVSSSTAGPCDGCDSALKSAELSTQGPPPLEEIKSSHESDIVESRYAPGEPHLIPEWERTTTQKSEESTTLGPKETATTVNEINKTAILDRVVKTNKSEALSKIETLPNDVDSDEKFGNKEPTTERPTTKGYASIGLSSEDGSADDSIDSELESSTVMGATDPKDDAESIKYNSSGGDSVSKEAFSFVWQSNADKNYWLNLARENGWVSRK